MSESELYIEAGTVKLRRAVYVTAAVELICLDLFSSTGCVWVALYYILLQLSFPTEAFSNIVLCFSSVKAGSK